MELELVKVAISPHWNDFERYEEEILKTTLAIFIQSCKEDAYLKKLVRHVNVSRMLLTKKTWISFHINSQKFTSCSQFYSTVVVLFRDCFNFPATLNVLAEPSKQVLLLDRYNKLYDIETMPSSSSSLNMNEDLREILKKSITTILENGGCNSKTDETVIDRYFFLKQSYNQLRFGYQSGSLITPNEDFTNQTLLYIM